MHSVIQGIILGVLTGGVYALMASGQDAHLRHHEGDQLAQGAMVIASAYLAYTLFTSFGIDPFVAVFITTPLMFVLGVSRNGCFLRPLRARRVGVVVAGHVCPCAAH